MKSGGYCLFETDLGTCGIAWKDATHEGGQPLVTHLQLPGANAAATERRIAGGSEARQPRVPPPPIAAVIDRVRRHLGGEVQDFRDVALDLEGAGPAARLAYTAAREIPPGQTRTYGDLAQAIGRPGAAQAVGQAMGRNPVPLIIPCHRVVAARGKPGGFSAFGGLATKARLLEIEGACLRPADRNLKFGFEGSAQDRSGRKVGSLGD